MAEYIGCRECDSPDCKGCNLKNLETMLRNGKFDCMMNGNRCINTAADVAPVKHGQWKRYSTTMMECSLCGKHTARHKYNFCPNCGAKMDGDSNG